MAEYSLQHSMAVTRTHKCLHTNQLMIKQLNKTLFLKINRAALLRSEQQSNI